MTSPEHEATPANDNDLGSWARLQIEQAEQAAGAHRLKILDELYEVLESNLAEDAPARQ